MAKSFFSLVTELETLLGQLNTILTGSDNETVEINGVSKDSISKVIKDRFAEILAMVDGKIPFETKALLDASGAPSTDALAEVWNDPVVSNNGYYGWSNGEWTPAVLTIKNTIDKNNQSSPVTGYAVSEYSKTKADLTSGKNIFDKEEVTLGYYMKENGEPLPNEIYFYSGYIAVSADTTYTFSHALRFITYYDENKSVISGEAYPPRTVSTPTGTHFVIFTANVSNLNDFQMENGEISTEFEEYMQLVSPSQLKNVFEALSSLANRLEASLNTLYGTSFPGAPEVFESISKRVSAAKLQLLDLDKRVLLEFFGNEARYDTEFESLSDKYKNSTILIDDENRILFLANKKIENEIVEARGEFLSLNERFSNLVSDLNSLSEVTSSISDKLSSPASYKYGEYFLRETRQRTFKLLTSESQQLTVLNIGDSWTHNSARYTGPAHLYLQQKFGDAGSGFTGFSWGFGDLPQPAGANKNVDPATLNVTLLGSWVSKYKVSSSPDICAIESSNVGDQVAINTSKIATHAILFAKSNGATIRYKFNDDAWNILTLSSSNEFYELINLPNSGFTLTIEVSSGVAELYGIDLHNDESGVITHKVGATGSKLADWAIQSQKDEWKANIHQLAPNLITILHGTNDQAVSSKSEFKASGQTLINNIREVLPLADILLIAPCENGAGRAIPMSDYQSAFYELAYENKCAFLNLQPLFGEIFDEYSHLSERAWFNQDLIHPDPLTGGRAIADALIRTLLN